MTIQPDVAAELLRMLEKLFNIEMRLVELRLYGFNVEHKTPELLAECLAVINRAKYG